jgi:hypothetical protein
MPTATPTPDFFWFGFAVGFLAATALYVWIPKVYDEVKTVLGNLFHHTSKPPTPPAPPAPPAATA